MNIIRKIYVRIFEITLLSILVFLPFSHRTITTQQIVFLLISLGMCLFIQLLKKIRPVNYQLLRVIYALLFTFIFDIAEKVDIIKHIPISTACLSIAMLAFMIKILVEDKVKLINHPFTKYFFYACVFLFILMGLFYPFFFHYYQMQLGSDIRLLSKLVKYGIIFILVVNYLSDEKKFKTINLGFILSISVILILNTLL